MSRSRCALPAPSRPDDNGLMDAPSPTPERSRELADLRRRAYGPDADIQRDPSAVLRLNELEDLVRETPDAVVDSLPGVGGEEDLDEEPAPAAAPPAPIPETPRRGRSRIPKWSIAAIAAVAGIVIGASALWLIQRSTSMEAPPDLTLKPTASGSSRGPGFAQNLDFWGVDRGTVAAYEPFDSIGVWTALSNDGSRCIVLSSEGQIFTATCAA